MARYRASRHLVGKSSAVDVRRCGVESRVRSSTAGLDGHALGLAISPDHAGHNGRIVFERPIH